LRAPLRINERTLEKWEQGRAKPNPQAAALVLLVRPALKREILRLATLAQDDHAHRMVSLKVEVQGRGSAAGKRKS